MFTMKKVLLCFLIAVVYAATAVPVEQQSDVPFKYPRFIEFPDGDGNPHKVDLEDRIDTMLIDEVTRNPANNKYFLYTRFNPTTSQVLEINNYNSVRISHFNPHWQTVVIAHGWLGHEEAGLNPLIRDAFLRKGDANVIIMDWKRLAHSNYITAANGVPAVGRALGQFLAFLNRITGARYENMHLVGFSLGAHLVSNAGVELGGRVARVTGLDPAGPLWKLKRDRMSPNAGVYVEAIHTDGGYTVGGLGIGSNVAHADFYANGGVSQPGCLTNLCNHNNAWRYFAASITYNHLIANRCRSKLQITLNRCKGDTLPMGNSDLRKRGKGMYRVNTSRRYPY